MDRIVSLAPSLTEAIFALGAGDQVVGRTKFCSRPSVALKVPVVASLLHADMEAIVAAKPTKILILADAGNPKSLAKRLEKRFPGRVMSFRLKGVADLKRLLFDLGKLLNRRDRAKQWIQELQLSVQSISSESILNDTSVAILLDCQTLIFSGQDTYLSEYFSLNGGRLTASEQGFFKSSLESLISNPPGILAFMQPSKQPRCVDRIKRRLSKVGVRFVELEDDRFLRPGIDTPWSLLQLQQKLRAFGAF